MYRANLHKHKIDFIDFEEIFYGCTITIEDDRERYREQRFITFSNLQGHIVAIVRKGLKPIAKKTQITLRLDTDVLNWFKSQGKGYQTI